jgi:1-acyl-sn-glycerol-3-phosphate acyltransferase
LLDPVLLGIFVKRKVSFMAKEELFKIPVLSFFIKKIGVFPVSRGTIDLSAMKMAIKTLKEGRVLGIFPEGGRVHKLEDDAAAKGGVAAFAYKTKATVFPAHIVCNGRIRLFKKIKVIYGKPIPFEEMGFTNGNSEEIKRISQEILDKIYSTVE